MDELNTLLSNSLDNYFRVLSKKGFIGQAKVNNIIALCAITHLLDKYGEFITEDDIRTISNALYCISGNCLIDFPTYLSEDSIFHEIKGEIAARLTQDTTTRNSEDGLFRIGT